MATSIKKGHYNILLIDGQALTTSTQKWSAGMTDVRQWIGDVIAQRLRDSRDLMANRGIIAGFVYESLTGKMHDVVMQHGSAFSIVERA